MDLNINERNGTLFELKWLFTGVLIFALIGVVVATAKVVFFEQNDGGLFAIHKECVLWDERCAKACEDSGAEGNRSAGCSCCLQYSDESTPIGMIGTL